MTKFWSSYLLLLLASVARGAMLKKQGEDLGRPTGYTLRQNRRKFREASLKNASCCFSSSWRLSSTVLTAMKCYSEEIWSQNNPTMIRKCWDRENKQTNKQLFNSRFCELLQRWPFELSSVTHGCFKLICYWVSIRAVCHLIPGLPGGGCDTYWYQVNKRGMRG